MVAKLEGFLHDSFLAYKNIFFFVVFEQLNKSKANRNQTKHEINLQQQQQQQQQQY